MPICKQALTVYNQTLSIHTQALPVYKKGTIDKWVLYPRGGYLHIIYRHAKIHVSHTGSTCIFIIKYTGTVKNTGTKNDIVRKKSQCQNMVLFKAVILYVQIPNLVRVNF